MTTTQTTTQAAPVPTTICAWCAVGAHEKAKSHRCDMLLNCTCKH